MQEERERRVLQRSKFEDQRAKQIQDLKVGMFVEE